MDVIYSGVSVREKRSQTFGPNSIYADRWILSRNQILSLILMNPKTLNSSNVLYKMCCIRKLGSTDMKNPFDLRICLQSNSKVKLNVLQVKNKSNIFKMFSTRLDKQATYLETLVSCGTSGKLCHRPGWKCQCENHNLHSYKMHRNSRRMRNSEIQFLMFRLSILI